MPTNQMQSKYNDIEFKQATCILLDAFHDGYVHHDAARRTGIRMQRRYDVSFVVGCITLTSHLYAEMSKKITTMVATQTVRASPDVRILVVQQTSPLPDSRSMMWL
ncbi:hypothetical protein TNCV_3392441 [Trichonephila clavipes]|nr:hypothetical protein TNCV_3392441 [Trichonephila clavipes]